MFNALKNTSEQMSNVASTVLTTVSVFTNLFWFRIKIRLKSGPISHYLFKKTWFLYTLTLYVLF